MASERPTPQLFTTRQLSTIMALPSLAQSASNEADISLTISSINYKQFKSVRKAVQVFNVPRTTVRRRRAGITARRDCEPNSKKLTKLEKEVITRYILNLDLQEFPPTLNAI